VFDALDSEALARSERQDCRRGPAADSLPRLLAVPRSVNGGSAVYADVFKIAHENYRAGLIDQMQRGNVASYVQQKAVAERDIRDRMTPYLGGKEIQSSISATPTQGRQRAVDAQDRIVYHERGVLQRGIPEHGGRLRCLVDSVLDAVKALDADIFIPGHGPSRRPEADAARCSTACGQILVDTRDRIQNEITLARRRSGRRDGELQQYEKMPQSPGTKEAVVRSNVQELKGTLQ